MCTTVCTVKCFHHEVISDCWLIDADWNCRNEEMMKDAKGPSLYYVSIFFAFYCPTHSLCQHKYSKNGHFLAPPTPSFYWRNIGMVPNLLTHSVAIWRNWISLINKIFLRSWKVFFLDGRIWVNFKAKFFLTRNLCNLTTPSFFTGSTEWQNSWPVKESISETEKICKYLLTDQEKFGFISE